MLLLLLHTMHACTNGPPNISESTASGSDSHSRTGFQTPENGATAPRPIEQVSCSRPVHAGSTRSVSRFRSQPGRIRMARAKTRSFSGARREDGPGGQARAPRCTGTCARRGSCPACTLRRRVGFFSRPARLRLPMSHTS